MLQLRNALRAIEPIRNLCLSSDQAALKSIGEQLNPCPTIRDRISREIREDAPVAVNRGEVIAEGVNPELDDLRRIAYQGKDYLLNIQQREIAATGISSLKIGYNNVFGYYIEVTNTHRDKVPSEWIRKQTLVNAERYITQELKEYEEKILGAQEKIESIQSRLYSELIAAVAQYIPALKVNASMLARLDVLLSFTRVAAENRYPPQKKFTVYFHVLDDE